MLVIDAPALVEVLTAEPTSIPELARRVHEAEWMSAPDLLDYEMLNVLRKLVLRGEIDEELAEASRLAIRELRLTRHPLTDQMSDRVWHWRHNVSAYDASYLALAEQLRVPLVTADQRLAEAGRRLATVVIECYIVDGAS